MRDTVAQTRRKRSRTNGLKRLYKVRLSTRVGSSKDEGLGEDDASKQGRIADIDANEDIYLVNVHNDEDMFGVNDLDGDEVIVESVDVAKQPKEVVDDITLAKALMEIKSAKLKVVKVVIQEPEQEQAPTPTVSSHQPSHVKEKGKGKMVEPEPVKKLSNKYQLMLDEELSFKQQAKEEEEERLQAEEQDEMTYAEKAKLFMQFLEKRRKLFAAKRAKEKSLLKGLEVEALVDGMEVMVVDGE
nr:hypothetical protein [Tanacetum cinerariifolium]